MLTTPAATTVGNKLSFHSFTLVVEQVDLIKCVLLPMWIDLHVFVFIYLLKVDVQKVSTVSIFFAICMLSLYIHVYRYIYLLCWRNNKNLQFVCHVWKIIPKVSKLENSLTKCEPKNIPYVFFYCEVDVSIVLYISYKTYFVTLQFFDQPYGQYRLNLVLHFCFPLSYEIF